MTTQQEPVAKAAMLIRKPVAEVFAAFVDPAITTQFWFTKSSGKLEAGQHVQWDWEMYNASSQVDVKALEPNRRILIEWSGYGTPNTVEWIFTPRADHTTFVSITNAGFCGSEDEIVQQALDSTGGFTLVLAGLKALLEHNIRLNLVGDRFPSDTGTRRSASVTRRFKATPERVFDAWLNPALASKWLFTLATSEANHTEIDARVGGKWRITDRRDGIDYTGVGEYLEIDRPRRLVFTFGMPQFSSSFDRVIVEIEPDGTGCRLTLTQEGLPAGYEESTINGWGKMFDLLVAAVEM